MIGRSMLVIAHSRHTQKRYAQSENIPVGFATTRATVDGQPSRERRNKGRLRLSDLGILLPFGAEHVGGLADDGFGGFHQRLG